MKRNPSHPLRTVRIVLAAVVVGLFSAFFLGLYPLAALVKPLQQIQVVPSLFGIGFILILLITIVTGRSYCSFLCPLGIFQDVLIAFSGKPRKKPHKPQSRMITGYLVLGAAVITFAAGSLVVVNLVDPYALFGRIVTNGLKPAILLANNGITELSRKINIYWLSYAEVHALSASLLIVSLGGLGIVTAMSLLRGRLYCNTICPVGALLSLPARFSLFAITIDTEKCTGCRRCETVCKAGCIDIDSRLVYTDRCVLCFDCLSQCPYDALAYSFSFPVKAAQPVNGAKKRMPAGTDTTSRRDFLIGAGTLAGSTAAGVAAGVLFNGGLSGPAGGNGTQSDGKPETLLPSQRREAARLFRATPPGSQNMRRYTSRCIGCHQCVSICPTRVLKPAVFTAGIEGMMVPVMDYSVGFCEYECNRCSRVCPTGAISPIAPEKKKRTQIGTVFLIDDDCVVFKNKEDCGACAEVCPTHAVTTEKRDGLFYPVVDNDPCIGCGSCEHACPVNPKAIFVEPKRIHGTAEPPKEAGPLRGGGATEKAATEKTSSFEKAQKGPEDAGEEEFPF